MSQVNSPVLSAAKMAIQLPPHTIKRASSRLHLVTNEIEHFANMHNNLMGIERPSSEKLLDKLTALKIRQSQLQSVIMFGQRCRLLSYEPLTWRDKQGWPKLIVLNLGSPRFEMEVIKWTSVWYGSQSGEHRSSGVTKRFVPQMCKVEKRRGGRTTISYEKRNLPNAISSCYSDVLNKLKMMACGRGCLTLVSDFEGLIPQGVKEKISESCEMFKEIFIIAEPKKFEVKESNIIINTQLRPNPDPLVVGFDGNRLWLIAQFDTTSVEEAMIFHPFGNNHN